MRIYQGASLSWHWSTGVLATAASGSYYAVKAFMLLGQPDYSPLSKGWHRAEAFFNSAAFSLS